METTKGVMLRILRWKKTSNLEGPIDALLEEMRVHDPEDKEYGVAVSYLERLTKLENEKKARKVSPDTIAIVLGGIAQVLVIVAYEQRHIFGSKGLGFILKPKGPKLGP